MPCRERENDTLAVHEFARRRNITLGVAFYTEAELFEQVPMVEWFAAVTVGLAATAAAAAVSIAIRAEKEVTAYANSSTILQVRKLYLKYIPETAKMFFWSRLG